VLEHAAALRPATEQAIAALLRQCLPLLTRSAAVAVRGALLRLAA